jgi:predicted transcriptional regulator
VLGRGVMDLTYPSKRRSSLVISIAILKAAKKGIRKTHLISSVSLSYEQSNKYIEFLKAHRLIEEHNNSFQTTQEGLELIEEFDSSSLIRSGLAT